MVMKVREDYYTGTNAQRLAYTGQLHAGVKWLESDTGDIYQYSGSSWSQLEDAGKTLVADQSTPAIRNPNSSTTSYVVTRKEGHPVILNGQTAITIGNSTGANDTLLHKIIIHTALTGTLTLAGFEDDGGAAQSFVFPAATPAGVYDMGDIINTKGTLQATLSSASDDNLVMLVWSDA